MTQVLRRITKKSKVTNNLKVFSTTQRSQALEHADIVIVSISVGQQRSEWFDIHIPLKFGIPQTVGDTCGPGGVFRALRVVPIFNEIVRDVAELCPKATIFNYTNPIAPLVLGANQTCSHVETIGICHELLGGMPVLLNFLKKLGRKNIQKWEGLDIKYSGINHFSWLLEINFQREDLYPLIRENASIGGKLADRPLNFALLEKYDYFPYPGGRHLVEFIPEYFNYYNQVKTWNKYSPGLGKHIDIYNQIFGIPRLRNVNLLDFERRAAIWGYHQIAKGIIPSPGPSLKGERAVEMIIDREKSSSEQYDSFTYRYHPVNIINTGKKVTNLPENCVIETSGYFKNGHLKADSVGTMPKSILTLVKKHADNTQKFVEAAVTGDIEKLLKALLNDPACEFIENDKAIEDMMWNMLYYEQKWVPKFKESIPSYYELRNHRYFVTKSDLREIKEARNVKWPPHKKLYSKAIL